MRFITKLACLVFLGIGIASPIRLLAQAQPAPHSPAAALSEQSKRGQGLFLQNCSLCHMPTKKNSKSAQEEGSTIGPRLNGRFSGPKALSEAVARALIQKGVQGKMPGFQYALSTNEIDAMIAYLKSL